MIKTMFTVLSYTAPSHIREFTRVLRVQVGQRQVLANL